MAMRRTRCIQGYGAMPCSTIIVDCSRSQTVCTRCAGSPSPTSTFVESDSGWVVIDPLTTVEVAAYALALVNEHLGERAIVAVCYSHTHSDHFGGVKGMISEDDVTTGGVRVVASEGFVEWVLKEQGLAAEGMPSRNDYMYGENLPISPTGIVDTGLGQAIEGGEVSYIDPTDIIGKEGGTLVIDGLELQFMYAPGEAPTGMHCYIPKYRTLHVADNCYMCLHNVYTIRGAFPPRCDAMVGLGRPFFAVRGYRGLDQWSQLASVRCQPCSSLPRRTARRNQIHA